MPASIRQTFSSATWKRNSLSFDFPVAFGYRISVSNSTIFSSLSPMSVLSEVSSYDNVRSAFEVYGDMLRDTAAGPFPGGSSTAGQSACMSWSRSSTNGTRELSDGGRTSGRTHVSTDGEGPHKGADLSPMPHCKSSNGFHGAKDTIEVSNSSTIPVRLMGSAGDTYAEVGKQRGHVSVTLHHRRPMQSTLIAGNKESPGYRSKMEDYTSIKPAFLQTRILHTKTETLIPDALSEGLCELRISESRIQRNTESEDLYDTAEEFHLVAVYDGHGGTDVAEQLSNELHERVAATVLSADYSSISNVKSELEAGSPVSMSEEKTTCGRCSVPRRKWGPLNGGPPSEVHDSFGSQKERKRSGDMDIDRDSAREQTLSFGNVFKQQCMCDSAELDDANSIPVLRLEELKERIVYAFETMNSDLPISPEKTVGSTAVVAMVSAHHIVVANVGDSRAVLRRNGNTFRLSRDHKPDEEDEEDRIRQSGGRVWDFNGRRVMGLLAMTRAFGDDCLKPFGICATPEVTILPRSEDDEFMILACDGLWDVISDEEASALVQRCFKRAQEREACPVSACRVAASVLFRAAFAKGSNDNISVVVVDLRSHETGDQ